MPSSRRPVCLLTRRAVLEQGGLLTVGLGLGLGCQPDPVYEKDSGNPDSGSEGGTTTEAVDLCATEPGNAETGWTAVELAQHPDLQEVGGWVHVTVDGIAMILVQPEEGCFVAASQRCTHEGEPVEWRSGRFVCPRHGATFRNDGEVIGGPTPVPLVAFEAGERDGKVWVLTQ